MLIERNYTSQIDTITQIQSDNLNTLQARGIAKTAHEANWQAIGNKWHYPIFAPNGATIATRTKLISGNGAKYSWYPSKPNNPDANFYILPDTWEAIQDANGICFLANGEPSLLSFHAAGIHNAICTTHSETTIPKNSIEYLHKVGITTLINIADNDEAGLQGATKWRDTLHDTGITYHAMQWGDVADKYDANDAWIDSGFNGDNFRTRLDTLKPLLLPAHEKPVKQVFNDSDFDNTPAGLIDAIASALGVRSWRGEWCKNVSSPLREDKNPSFGINRDGVGYDFATGESYSPIEIAEALGIDPRAYYPKRTKRSKNRVNQGLNNVPEQQAKKPVIFEPRFIDTEQFYDSRGLPSLMIAGLSIATGGKSSLPLIASKLISATASGLLPALKDNDSVDIKTLAKITGISRQQIDRVLPQLIDLSIVKEANATEMPPIEGNTIGGNSVAKGYSYPVRSASKRYQVNISRDISGYVLEALRKRYTEFYFKGTSAPLDDLMAVQIGLNEDIYDKYQAVFNGAIDADRIKPKLSAIKREFAGNGTWKGWNTLLTDSQYDTFLASDDMPKTMGEWRVFRMARLNRIDNQRDRSEWMRHLGTLSKSTIRNTRNRANLASIEQKSQSEVYSISADDRRDAKTLKSRVMNEIKHASKELKGRAISANLQVKNSSEPINVSLFNGDFQDAIKKYRNVLTGISFTVQTASIYRDMTENEVEAMAQKEANKQAKKEANMNTVEPTIQDEKEVTLSHPVTEYDPEFIRQSVAKLYEKVTGHYPPDCVTSKEIVISTIAHYEALSPNEKALIRQTQ